MIPSRKVPRLNQTKVGSYCSRWFWDVDSKPSLVIFINLKSAPLTFIPKVIRPRPSSWPKYVLTSSAGRPLTQIIAVSWTDTLGLRIVFSAIMFRIFSCPSLPPIVDLYFRRWLFRLVQYSFFNRAISLNHVYMQKSNVCVINMIWDLICSNRISYSAAAACI